MKEFSLECVDRIMTFAVWRYETGEDLQYPDKSERICTIFTTDRERIISQRDIVPLVTCHKSQVTIKRKAVKYKFKEPRKAFSAKYERKKELQKTSHE